MANHINMSLDYFPIDTSWDLKMRLILANFGMEGIGAIILLEQMIFREGYACEWNEETKHLFLVENGASEKRIDEILEYCLNHDIFDRNILDNYGFLTSKAIQLQWVKIRQKCRRKTFGIEPKLSLVDCADIEASQDDLAKGNAFVDSEESRKSSENLQQTAERMRKPSEAAQHSSEDCGTDSENFGQKKGIKESKEKKGRCAEPRDSTHGAQGFLFHHKDIPRAGESPMMQQILRSLETKKEKGPD
jgi:hypothetical protein